MSLYGKCMNGGLNDTWGFVNGISDGLNTGGDGQLKPSKDESIHLWGAAEVSLSKAPNPSPVGVLCYVADPSLCACVYVSVCYY